MSTFLKATLAVAALAITSSAGALTEPTLQPTPSLTTSTLAASGAPFAYANGTVSSGPHPTGTGITNVPTSGIYNGPLPDWANQFISAANAIDQAEAKAFQAIEEAFDKAEDLLGLGSSSSTAAAPAESSAIIEKRKGGKPKPPPSPSPKPSPSPSPKPSPSPEPSPKPSPSPSPSPKPSPSPSPNPSSSPKPSHNSSPSPKPSSEPSKTTEKTTSKTTNSHSTATSKTTTSGNPKATSLTPLCGPKNCRPRAKVCPNGQTTGLSGKLSKGKGGKAPKPRSASGSLAARAIIPRAYQEDINPATYVADPYNNLPDGTLIIPTVNRYPAITETKRDDEDEEEDQIGMFQSTSQISSWDDILSRLADDADQSVKDGFAAHTGPLSGCTGVYIVSDEGFFYAHYWQTTAFDSISASKYNAEVTTPLMRGLSTAGGQDVQDSLYEQRALFGEGKNTEVFIMTPAVNNRVLYSQKINQLKAEIARIIGVAVTDIKVHKYQQEDNGYYEPGKTFAGLKGVNRKYKGEPAVYFKEKVHKHTGADGYGLMEFSRNQDGTKSGWRVYYEAEKMGERSFDPAPADDDENQDENQNE